MNTKEIKKLNQRFFYDVTRLAKIHVDNLIETHYNLSFANQTEKLKKQINDCEKELDNHSKTISAYAKLLSTFSNQTLEEKAEKSFDHKDYLGCKLMLDIIAAKGQLKKKHYFLYAYCCNEYGDVITAEEYYRKEIENNVNSASAYNNLGIILADKGNKEEAKSLFRKAWTISKDALYIRNLIRNTEGPEILFRLYEDAIENSINPELIEKNYLAFKEKNSQLFEEHPI